MAFPGAAAARACSITANIFDGTRQPIAASTEVLYTLVDGNQKTVFSDDVQASSLTVEVPFHDNFGDSYAVIAFADGYQQAGFHPVKVVPGVPQQVDLMLLGKDASFNFSGARLADIQQKRPVLGSVLTAG